ncbi:hypothetical protein VNO77_33570 [Canavalia gladiata]|uniref:Uncharacterized protein n=1 Tax=Canavalia gladiata TaxID=3824 RepID=A0AAN9KE54_CANGL
MEILNIPSKRNSHSFSASFFSQLQSSHTTQPKFTETHPIGQNSPTQLKTHSKIRIFGSFHSQEAQNFKRVGVE